MKSELLHDIVAAMREADVVKRRAFVLREATVRAWVRSDGLTGRPSDDFEGCTE